ncbi:Methionine aminopeptidase 2, partial [Bienertia sinuspersici]
MDLNKAWMKVKNRSPYDYVKGVDNFLNFALSNVREEDKEIITIRCPCNNCRNILIRENAYGVASMNVGVEDELVNENEYVSEETNENAKKIYRLLQQYQEPLIVKGMTMTKLANIVKLPHTKI